ncbi:glycosyltransferase family 2 protein [Nocardioides alcanivorans]|uniref:glycosyltransferase family 2 protein n=1 Tax=Nocardioides alcanivorans TaxID=2897352 RepID=UPI001F1B0D74|nr:glycosyltransferase family 2 protein [Nocardioides alcanivorans]
MSPLRSVTPNPRVSVIVPAFNEAANLERVLPTLPSVHEVIVVDGESTDGTAEAARRTLPGCTVIKQTRKGKGNALACGFAEATGDIIVMFDADGSADAREIELMVAALVNGADFVKGSRMLHGGGSADLTGVRSVGNRALTKTVNVLFRTRYTDLCYGYNAFWRDTLETFDLPDPTMTGEPQWGDGFEIETLLNCRAAAARMTILEIPSFEHSRIHGLSNLRAFHDGVRVLRTINTEHRRLRIQRHGTRHLGASARFSERPRRQLATAAADGAA